jgi:hypothetical protein
MVRRLLLRLRAKGSANRWMTSIRPRKQGSFHEKHCLAQNGSLDCVPGGDVVADGMQHQQRTRRSGYRPDGVGSMQ